MIMLCISFDCLLRTIAHRAFEQSTRSGNYIIPPSTWVCSSSLLPPPSTSTPSSDRTRRFSNHIWRLKLTARHHTLPHPSISPINIAIRCHFPLPLTSRLDTDHSSSCLSSSHLSTKVPCLLSLRLLPHLLPHHLLPCRPQTHGQVPIGVLYPL